MFKNYFSSALLCSFVLLGCGKNEAILGAVPQTDLGSESPPLAVPPLASPITSPVGSTIKSNIDFSAIIWPKDMMISDQRALELALNITGSFEGNESWINISNNSDKQGMSLGLLSQNFGSGTLQPLLIKMQENYPGVMAKIFSSAHLASLYAMITDWKTQTPPIVPGTARISLLDMVPMADPNANSVTWAAQNLYSGSTFITQWKNEFQTMAATPQYINFQFADAISMHSAAKAYAVRTGVAELRAYLMMFDVVDQDGYMPDQDFADYATYLQANPKATNTARLAELVTLRIRHVNPVYSPDVKSRKMAIVNGQGLVHGIQRNLETEFNFSRLEVY